MKRSHISLKQILQYVDVYSTTRLADEAQMWRGLWVKKGGWVAARNALNSVGQELRRLGVKTAFGTAGTFDAPLLSEDGTQCIGVRTVDGTEWGADLVIMATGAWSPTLIDLEGQCVSKVKPLCRPS